MTPAKQLIDTGAARDRAADHLYTAGIRYIAALDAWIEASKGSSSHAGEVAYSQRRRRMTEMFLLRVFPERETDSNPPAE
jgi:hypothetical protein